MVAGPGGIGSIAQAAPAQQIRFRPDPGEPAVRLNAPPQQTAGLVSAQEQRNETRLRLQALAEGNDVIFSNRSFTLGLGPNSPVFNAGLTTLNFREDPNGILPDSIPILFSDQNPQEAQEAERAEVEEEDEENPLSPDQATSLLGAAQNDEEELEREEQELENEDSRLNRNLTRALLEQEQALQEGDPALAIQASQDINRLELKLEEVEDNQREVELDQFARRLEDAIDSSSEAIAGNVSAAAGLLDVLFGLGGDDEPDRQAA